MLVLRGASNLKLIIVIMEWNRAKEKWNWECDSRIKTIPAI